MKINDVMLSLLECVKEISPQDQRIFHLVYIRMLLRSLPLSLGMDMLEDLRNSMKYYYENDFENPPQRLAEAFLRSNI